jgi:hypothetical protein
LIFGGARPARTKKEAYRSSSGFKGTESPHKEFMRASSVFVQMEKATRAFEHRPDFLFDPVTLLRTRLDRRRSMRVVELAVRLIDHAAGGRPHPST